MEAIYRGAIPILSANWFLDIPLAFRAALIAAPNALKSYSSVVLFMSISPNYILPFTFPLRYEYTYHSVD